MQLDKRVVPEELIVGIKGDLCYVTYIQGKKLNSETSWTSWSQNSNNPLKITNKFNTGFKISGVNGRWSSQASNSENLLITHPLFNKDFELPLSRFTNLAQKVTIVNGEIQEELIMDFHRNILLKDEYLELVSEADEKAKEKAELSSQAKVKKVKAKDQVPGMFYEDYISKQVYIYLGTARIDNNIKHVYFKAAGNDLQPHITEDITIWNSEDWRNREGRKEIVSHPSIVTAHNGVYKPTYYVSQYNFSIVKSKKSLSKPKNIKLHNINIFREFSDEDWDLIKTVYKFDDNHLKEYRHRSYNENWSKAEKGHAIHFREEYEDMKNYEK
jgi:hypothetical protein